MFMIFVIGVVSPEIVLPNLALSSLSSPCPLRASSSLLLGASCVSTDPDKVSEI